MGQQAIFEDMLSKLLALVEHHRAGLGAVLESKDSWVQVHGAHDVLFAALALLPVSQHKGIMRDIIAAKLIMNPICKLVLLHFIVADFPDEFPRVAGPFSKSGIVCKSAVEHKNSNTTWLHESWKSKCYQESIQRIQHCLHDMCLWNCHKRRSWLLRLQGVLRSIVCIDHHHLVRMDILSITGTDHVIISEPSLVIRIVPKLRCI